MRIRRILKSTALILVVIFTTTTVAWSAPENVFTYNRAAAKEFTVSSVLDSLDIPNHLGRVDLLRQADPGAPALIHIQEAHANSGAHERIRELLRYLTEQHDFDLIFLEGGAGPFDSGRFRLLQDPALNIQVIDQLEMMGEVNGAEGFLISSEKHIRGVGAENPDLYWRNFSEFRNVLKEKDKTDVFVTQLKHRLSALGSRLANTRLQKFIKEWMLYQDSQRDALRHLATLQKSAREVLGMDFNDPVLQRAWPSLLRYFKLKDLEASVHLSEAAKEWNKLRDRLEAWGLETETIQNLQSFFDEKNAETQFTKDPRRFLEVFYQKVKPFGFRFDQYRAFSTALAVYTLQSEIQVGALFAEIETLTGQLLNAMALTQMEKRWVELYRDWILVKKLFALELTREDWQHVKDNKNELNPSLLDQRAAALDPSFKREITPADSQLTYVFEQAAAFYDTAVLRDRAMAENVMQTMQSLGKDRAIMVTGGFHAEGLGDSFSRRGFHFTSFMPRVSELENSEKYLRTMLFGTSYLRNPSYGFSLTAPDAHLDLARDTVLHQIRQIDLALKSIQPNKAAAISMRKQSRKQRSELRSEDEADALKREVIDILKRAFPFSAEVEKILNETIQATQHDKYTEAQMRLNVVIDMVMGIPHQLKPDSSYVKRLWNAFAQLERLDDLSRSEVRAPGSEFSASFKGRDWLLLEIPRDGRTEFKKIYLPTLPLSSEAFQKTGSKQQMPGRSELRSLPHNKREARLWRMVGDWNHGLGNTASAYVFWRKARKVLNRDYRKEQPSQAKEDSREIIQPQIEPVTPKEPAPAPQTNRKYPRPYIRQLNSAEAVLTELKRRGVRFGGRQMVERRMREGSIRAEITEAGISPSFLFVLNDEKLNGYEIKGKRVFPTYQEEIGVNDFGLLAFENKDERFETILSFVNRVRNVDQSVHVNFLSVIKAQKGPHKETYWHPMGSDHMFSDVPHRAAIDYLDGNILVGRFADQDRYYEINDTRVLRIYPISYENLKIHLRNALRSYGLIQAYEAEAWDDRIDRITHALAHNFKPRTHAMTMPFRNQIRSILGDYGVNLNSAGGLVGLDILTKNIAETIQYGVLPRSEMRIAHDVDDETLRKILQINGQDGRFQELKAFFTVAQGKEYLHSKNPLIIEAKNRERFRFSLYGWSRRVGKLIAIEVHRRKDDRDSLVGYFDFQLGKDVATADFDHDSNLYDGLNAAVRIREEYQNRKIGTYLILLGMYLSKMHGKKYFDLRRVLEPEFFESVGFQRMQSDQGEVFYRFDLENQYLPALPDIEDPPVRSELRHAAPDYGLREVVDLRERKDEVYDIQRFANEFFRKFMNLLSGDAQSALETALKKTKGLNLGSELSEDDQKTALLSHLLYGKVLSRDELIRHLNELSERDRYYLAHAELAFSAVYQLSRDEGRFALRELLQTYHKLIRNAGMEKEQRTDWDHDLLVRVLNVASGILTDELEERKDSRLDEALGIELTRGVYIFEHGVLEALGELYPHEELHHHSFPPLSRIKYYLLVKYLQKHYPSIYKRMESWSRKDRGRKPLNRALGGTRTRFLIDKQDLLKSPQRIRTYLRMAAFTAAFNHLTEQDFRFMFQHMTETYDESSSSLGDAIARIKNSIRYASAPADEKHQFERIADLLSKESLTLYDKIIRVYERHFGSLPPETRRSEVRGEDPEEDRMRHLGPETISEIIKRFKISENPALKKAAEEISHAETAPIVQKALQSKSMGLVQDARFGVMQSLLSQTYDAQTLPFVEKWMHALSDERLKVKRLIYPGGGFDTQTAVSFLRIFPRVEEVVIVDTFDGKQTEQDQRTYQKMWESNLKEAALKRMILMDRVKVYVLNQNYFNIPSLAGAPVQGMTVVIDKFPGHNAEMRADERYRESILRDVRPGDLIFSLRRGRHEPLQWVSPPILDGMNMPYLFENPEGWAVWRIRRADFAGSKYRLPGQSLSDVKFYFYSELPENLKDEKLYLLIQSSYAAFNVKLDYDEIVDRAVNDWRSLQFPASSRNAMIAFHKDRPVGIYEFTLDKDWAAGSGIYVAEQPREYRQAGIASMLMDELLVELKKRNFRRFEVSHIRTSPASQSLQRQFLRRHMESVIDIGINRENGRIQHYAVDLAKFNALRSEVRNPVKILLADLPANAETVQLLSESAVPFGDNARFLSGEAVGIGKNEAKLREVLKNEHPEVILIRSDTVAFKDPDFVKWAGEQGVRVIIRMGAGVDNVHKQAASEAEISLIRTHGNADSVANLTLRFLLAALDRGQVFEDFKDVTEDAEWGKIFTVSNADFLKAAVKSEKAGRGGASGKKMDRVFKSVSPDSAKALITKLKGNTIGLVGFGPIAQEVAAKLGAIRDLTGIPFTVMAISPSLTRGDPQTIRIAEKLKVLHPDEKTFLKETDILSLHLPGDQDSYLNRTRLSQAPRLRIVINTARQGAVEANALDLFLLNSDHLYFADVDLAVKGEPIASLQPFLVYPNAYFLPHIAASTDAAGRGVEEKTLTTLKNVLELLLGSEPTTPLDIVNGIQPRRAEMHTEDPVKPGGDAIDIALHASILASLQGTRLIQEGQRDQGRELRRIGKFLLDKKRSFESNGTAQPANPFDANEWAPLLKTEPDAMTFIQQAIGEFQSRSELRSFKSEDPIRLGYKMYHETLTILENMRHRHPELNTLAEWKGKLETEEALEIFHDKVQAYGLGRYSDINDPKDVLLDPDVWPDIFNNTVPYGFYEIVLNDPDELDKLMDDIVNQTRQSVALYYLRRQVRDPESAQEIQDLYRKIKDDNLNRSELRSDQDKPKSNRRLKQQRREQLLSELKALPAGFEVSLTSVMKHEASVRNSAQRFSEKEILIMLKELGYRAVRSEKDTIFFRLPKTQLILDDYYQTLNELSGAWYSHTDFYLVPSDAELSVFYDAADKTKGGTQLGVSFDLNFTLAARSEPSTYVFFDENSLVTEVLVPFYAYLILESETPGEFLGRLLGVKLTPEEVRYMLEPEGREGLRLDFILPEILKRVPEKDRQKNIQNILEREIFPRIEKYREISPEDKTRMIRLLTSRFTRHEHMVHWLMHHAAWSRTGDETQKTWLSDAYYGKTRALWQRKVFKGVTGDWTEAERIERLRVWLKDNGKEPISLIYLSNVNDWLPNPADKARFFENLSRLLFREDAVLLTSNNQDKLKARVIAYSELMRLWRKQQSASRAKTQSGRSEIRSNSEAWDKYIINPPDIDKPWVFSGKHLIHTDSWEALSRTFVEAVQGERREGRPVVLIVRPDRFAEQAILYASHPDIQSDPLALQDLMNLTNGQLSALREAIQKGNAPPKLSMFSDSNYVLVDAGTPRLSYSQNPDQTGPFAVSRVFIIRLTDQKPDTSRSELRNKRETVPRREPRKVPETVPVPKPAPAPAPSEPKPAPKPAPAPKEPEPVVPAPKKEITQSYRSEIRKGMKPFIFSVVLASILGLATSLNAQSGSRDAKRVPPVTQIQNQDPAAVQEWIKKLSEPDKEPVIEALTKIGKPAVPALMEALQSEHITIRINAARALGRIQDPAAIPALVDALGKTYPWVDREIEAAILKFGAEAVPALEQDLREPKKWHRRETIIKILGQIDHPSAASAISSVLTDGVAHYREAAKKELERRGEFGWWDWLKYYVTEYPLLLLPLFFITIALAQLLFLGVSQFVRYISNEFILMLASAGFPGMQKLLRHILIKSENKNQRERAAHYLRYYGESADKETVLNLIKSLLDTNDSSLRSTIIQSLVDMKSNYVVNHLTLFLNSKLAKARRRTLTESDVIADILLKIGTPKAKFYYYLYTNQPKLALQIPEAPELAKEAISHSEESIAVNSALILEAVEGASAAPYLIEQLGSHRAHGARPAFIEILGRLKDERAVPVLIQNLENTPLDRKALAAYHIEEVQLTQKQLIAEATTKALENIATPRALFYKFLYLNDLRSAIGITGSFELAAEALSHSNNYVRRQAVKALGMTKDPRAITVLIRIAEINDLVLQRSVVDALSGYGPTILPILRKEIQDREAGIAVSPSSYLGSNSENAFAVLVRAMGSIVKPSDKDNFLFLTQIIDKYIDWEKGPIPIAAVEVLGEMADQSFVSLLSKALNHAWHPIREEAVKALGKIGDPSVGPKLLKLLDDENIRVQIETARALGILGNPIAAPDLMKKLRSGNPALQSEVIKALGDLKYEAATSHLVQLLYSSEFEKIVSQALAKIGTPEALFYHYLFESDLAQAENISRGTSLAQEALYHNNFHIRVQAVRLLERTWSEEERFNKAVEALKNSNHSTRLVGILLLRKVSKQERKNLLLDAIRDPDDFVRRHAVSLLIKINDPVLKSEIVESLNAFLNEQDADIRQSHFTLLAGWLRNNQALWEAIKPFRKELEKAFAVKEIQHGISHSLAVLGETVNLKDLITLGAKVGAGTHIEGGAQEKRIALPTADPKALAEWVFKNKTTSGANNELQISVGYDTGILPAQEERGKFIALYLFISTTYLSQFQSLKSKPLRDPNAAYGILIRGDVVNPVYPGQAKGKRLDYIFNLSNRMTEKSLEEHIRQIQLLNLGLQLSSAEESFQTFITGGRPSWMNAKMQKIADIYRNFEQEFIQLLRAYNSYLDSDDIFSLDEEGDHEERQRAFRTYRLEEALFPTTRWLVPLYGTDDRWNRLIPYLRGIEGMMLHQGLGETERNVEGEEHRLTIGSEFIRDVRKMGYETVEKIRQVIDSDSVPNSKNLLIADPFIDSDNEEATRFYLQSVTDAIDQSTISEEHLVNPKTFWGAVKYYKIQSSKRSEIRLNETIPQNNRRETVPRREPRKVPETVPVPKPAPAPAPSEPKPAPKPAPAPKEPEPVTPGPKKSSRSELRNTGIENASEAAHLISDLISHQIGNASMGMRMHIENILRESDKKQREKSLDVIAGETTRLIDFLEAFHGKTKGPFFLYEIKGSKHLATPLTDAAGYQYSKLLRTRSHSILNRDDVNRLDRMVQLERIYEALYPVLLKISNEVQVVHRDLKEFRRRAQIKSSFERLQRAHSALDVQLGQIKEKLAHLAAAHADFSELNAYLAVAAEAEKQAGHLAGYQKLAEGGRRILDQRRHPEERRQKNLEKIVQDLKGLMPAVETQDARRLVYHVIDTLSGRPSRIDAQALSAIFSRHLRSVRRSELRTDEIFIRIAPDTAIQAGDTVRYPHTSMTYRVLGWDHKDYIRMAPVFKGEVREKQSRTVYRHDLNGKAEKVDFRSEMRISKEAAGRFKAEFGERADEVLKFVTGDTELSRIKAYSTIPLKEFKIGEENRVWKFNHAHDLTLRGGKSIRFYSTFVDGARQAMSENEKIWQRAHQYGLGPKAKVFGDTLVTLQAEGETLDQIDPSKIRLGAMEALGYALGRLHSAGIAHQDLLPKHMFVRKEGSQAHISFIDYGNAREDTDGHLGKEEKDSLLKRILENQDNQFPMFSNLNQVRLRHHYLKGYEEGKVSIPEFRKPFPITLGIPLTVEARIDSNGKLELPGAWKPIFNSWGSWAIADWRFYREHEQRAPGIGVYSAETWGRRIDAILPEDDTLFRQIHREIYLRYAPLATQVQAETWKENVVLSFSDHEKFFSRAQIQPGSPVIVSLILNEDFTVSHIDISSIEQSAMADASRSELRSDRSGPSDASRDELRSAELNAQLKSAGAPDEFSDWIRERAKVRLVWNSAVTNSTETKEGKIEKVTLGIDGTPLVWLYGWKNYILVREIDWTQTVRYGERSETIDRIDAWMKGQTHYPQDWLLEALKLQIQLLRWQGKHISVKLTAWNKLKPLLEELHSLVGKESMRDLSLVEALRDHYEKRHLKLAWYRVKPGVIIRDIVKHWPYIRQNGALIFDVDGVLIRESPDGKATPMTEPISRYFTSLLKLGVHTAVISASSEGHMREDVIKPLQDALGDENADLLQNLTVYYLEKNLVRRIYRKLIFNPESKQFELADMPQVQDKGGAALDYFESNGSSVSNSYYFGDRFAEFDLDLDVVERLPAIRAVSLDASPDEFPARLKENGFFFKWAGGQERRMAEILEGLLRQLDSKGRSELRSEDQKPVIFTPRLSRPARYRGAKLENIPLGDAQAISNVISFVREIPGLAASALRELLEGIDPQRSPLILNETELIESTGRSAFRQLHLFGLAGFTGIDHREVILNFRTQLLNPVIYHLTHSRKLQEKLPVLELDGDRATVSVYEDAAAEAKEFLRLHSKIQLASRSEMRADKDDGKKDWQKDLLAFLTEEEKQSLQLVQDKLKKLVADIGHRAYFNRVAKGGMLAFAELSHHRLGDVNMLFHVYMNINEERGQLYHYLISLRDNLFKSVEALNMLLASPVLNDFRFPPAAAQDIVGYTIAEGIASGIHSSVNRREFIKEDRADLEEIRDYLREQAERLNVLLTAIAGRNRLEENQGNAIQVHFTIPIPEAFFNQAEQESLKALLARIAAISGGTISDFDVIANTLDFELEHFEIGAGEIAQALDNPATLTQFIRDGIYQKWQHEFPPLAINMLYDSGLDNGVHDAIKAIMNLVWFSDDSRTNYRNPEVIRQIIEAVRFAKVVSLSRSEIRGRTPPDTKTGLRIQSIHRALLTYNPGLEPDQAVETVSAVARELLFELLHPELIAQRADGKGLSEEAYQYLLSRVMPVQKDAIDWDEVKKYLTEQDEAILFPGDTKLNTFGLSIVSAQHYDESDLALARLLLDRFPHKLQVVVVEDISDERLRELNLISDEKLNGRVLIVRESEKGYAATIDQIFRGERKAFPLLSKLISVANVLSQKSGLGEPIKLQGLLKYTSVVTPEGDVPDLPYFDFLKSQLENRGLKQANQLALASTISILTAGVEHLDAMHLDAETIRNLREIKQVGSNRYHAVLSPQHAFITALENLQRAAQATLTAA